MKIVMIFDQIQSGLGTKDDTMVPLTGKKEPVGPAVMMQPFLKEMDGMAARVADDINTTTGVKAFAAMSEENVDTIQEFKNKVAIVKTPKKGGLGLNDALKNICKMAKAMVEQDPALEKLKQEVCY